MEALIDFYENGFTAFGGAVMRFDKSTGDVLKARAETVLCARAIE